MISPKMAMIDMEEIYGTNVLSKGHIFQTGAVQLCLYRTTVLIKIDSARSRGVVVGAKRMRAHKTGAHGNSA